MMKGDWSNLPTDLLSEIGYKLHLGADRLNFHGVSSSWRSALPFPQPPWLILAEPLDPAPDFDTYYGTPFVYRDDDYHNNPDYKNPDYKEKDKETVSTMRGFVGLGDQLVYELDLPEAHDKRFLGSSGTWIITLDIDGVIKLLNPFSRVQYELPPQSTNPDFDDYEGNLRKTRDFNMRKVVKSSSSSIRDSIFMDIAGQGRKLSFAKIGDESWIRCPTPEYLIDDIVFYKEQFYVVNVFGVVMVCDITDGLDHPKALALTSRFQQPDPKVYCTKFYLVEWMGDLIVVKKVMDSKKMMEFSDMPTVEKRFERMNRSEDNLLCKPKGFEVYRLNFADKKWEDLKNLGECSLFLGINTSIAVLSSNKCFKKNCIYFTDDYYTAWILSDTLAGRAMGVFDMETKSIQPHYKGVSTSRYWPPIWLVPGV